MTNLLLVPQIPNLPNLDEILAMETKTTFQTMSILNEVFFFLQFFVIKARYYFFNYVLFNVQIFFFSYKVVYFESNICFVNISIIVFKKVTGLYCYKKCVYPDALVMLYVLCLTLLKPC